MDFFKYEWKKGLVFVFLVLITFVPENSILVIPASSFGVAHGFPLMFYASYDGEIIFNFLHLLLDLIILYLFSCLGIFLYRRYRH